MESILGYKPEEFYDNPNLATQLFHPKDRSMLNAMGRTLRERFLGQTVRLRSKEGWYVPLRSWTMPIYDDDGMLLSVYGLATPGEEAHGSDRDVVEIPWRAVWDMAKKKYPTLEPEQIGEFQHYVVELMQEAIAESRESHPDKALKFMRFR